MISIEHHNSTSNGPVNTKSSFIRINSKNFILDFLKKNAKGDLVAQLREITKLLQASKDGIAPIDRRILASLAKCDKDTVSANNIRLVASGIINIKHVHKHPNIYSSEYLPELISIFNGRYK